MPMIPINIDELLDGTIIEDNRIEFKSDWNPEKVLHTICAFANDYDNIGGGYIVVGVAEIDGRPIDYKGFDPKTLPAVESELSELCNLISPRYVPSTSLEKYHGKDINLTEALTIEASKEMDKAVKEGRPFYLYMSHYAIHAPWEPDTRFWDKYKEMGLPELQAKYASMLESMDKSLGDFMALIRRLGIEENTIIIFMSDNGQPSQSVPNKPLRGHKISPYEGGIRVPMIVDIPHVTKPGSSCDMPIIIEDIFPTILSLAGATSYVDKETVIDGIDISPFFEGKKIKGYKDRVFYWHYPHIYDHYPYSVIRKGDYKLIYRYDKQKIELYDIVKDISETNDLSQKEVALCNDLLKQLKQHIKEINASVPCWKATGKAIELVVK